MVYCNLISSENGIATYSIGAVSNDITGILKIDANKKEYSIEKEPEKESLYMRHVDSMIHRASKMFAKGEFPKVLSHQIC